MKLLTKEILDAFKKQGYTENKKPEDIKIIVKFFGGSSFSCYCYEYDPVDRIYQAFCNLGDDQMAECGSLNQDQLESVTFPPFNLGVERDMYFGEHTLDEVMNFKVR